MIFVDFDGNGKINPEDIAISLAMEEDTDGEDDEKDDIQRSGS